MSNFPYNQPFRWSVGFEGSFLPHLDIDQYHWTQHSTYWREDFEKVRTELGCRWVRYPLAWHEIETAPGVFDWRWSDERFAYAASLGLNLVVELVHCGTPQWLPKSFGDDEFPAALERFARALGRRYGTTLRAVCPFNEPTTAALLGGDYGVWPPFGRGLPSYAAVSLRIAQATQRAIAALREEVSTVEIWVNDAVEAPRKSREFSNPEILQRLQRRHLNLDLVLGRVDQTHSLRRWMNEYGASQSELDEVVHNAPTVDVLALHYYAHGKNNNFTDEGATAKTSSSHCGLYRAAQHYWNRYGIPLAITESRVPTSEATREDWLNWSVSQAKRLRESGIPLVGYTWRSVLDTLEWSSTLRPVVGQIQKVGLFHLQREAQGKLSRHASAMSRAYATLIRQGDEAAGTLAPVIEAQCTKKQSDVFRRFTKKEIMSTSLPARDGFASSRPSFSLIVHSHLRWDWVWQRPQQFLSRLSVKHPVLFCEGPRLVDEDITPYYSVEQDEKYPNVSVLLMHLPASRFGDGDWVDATRTHLLKEALAGPLKGKYNRPVQWFYDPMATPAFAGKIGEIANVYDCMDQLSQFRFAPPELISRERQLLKKADVVFAGGYKMWEDKKQHNENSHFYGCGVDVDHFATARSGETVVPADINFVERPILGYFGVVDERLDYDLIARLADSNPNWNVCIVGPPCKIDPNELPQRDNLFWLGGRPYAELPAYAKAFDVCLMPFALNEATEFINPTKTLEYMAMGKPIVSTPVPDVVTNFGRNVAVSSNSDEFIALCRQAAENPDCDQIKRGLEMANRNTWDYIVSQLERHIEEAIIAKTQAQRAVSHHNAVEHKSTHRAGADRVGADRVGAERRSAARTATRLS